MKEIIKKCFPRHRSTNAAKINRMDMNLAPKVNKILENLAYQCNRKKDAEYLFFV